LCEAFAECGNGSCQCVETGAGGRSSEVKSVALAVDVAVDGGGLATA
jgi:hypothetical protein